MVWGDDVTKKINVWKRNWDPLYKQWSLYICVYVYIYIYIYIYVCVYVCIYTNFIQYIQMCVFCLKWWGESGFYAMKIILGWSCCCLCMIWFAYSCGIWICKTNLLSGANNVQFCGKNEWISQIPVSATKKTPRNMNTTN